MGPAASLHGRWPPPRVTPTPAPCDYEPSKAIRSVLDHAPAFSIGLRVNLPQPGSKTPGGNQIKHRTICFFLVFGPSFEYHTELGLNPAFLPCALCMVYLVLSLLFYFELCCLFSFIYL